MKKEINMSIIQICNMFAYYLDNHKMTNKEIDILYNKINNNLIRIKEQHKKRNK